MIIYNYITTNLLNNKKYVGMHTSSEVDDGYLGSGKALLAAVKKYGKENFIREVLCFCKTMEEAFKNEAIFIKEYKTLTSDGGYNISPTGGTECNGRHSSESKAKMGEKAKGRNSWSKGLTKETDDRLMCISGKNSPHSKVVIQYSLDGDRIRKWKCISSAGSELNIYGSSISNCAHGKASSAGGYLWKFEKPSNELKKRYKKMEHNREWGEYLGKSVLQYDLKGKFLKEWRGEMDAQRGLGVFGTSISACAHKELETAGGFIWRFKKEGENIEKIHEEIISIVKKRKEHIHHAMIPVFQYTKSGKFIKEWNGAIEAVRKIKVSGGGICDCANNRIKTSGGYIWVYKNKGETQDGINKRVKEMVKDRKKQPHHLSKPIIQYSTKESLIKEWGSATMAQEDLGFDQGGISACALGKKPTAYGFVWKFKNK